MAAFRVADLGGGVGISGDGYAQAGFEVVGFDINPKCAKWYPYEFHCVDVLTLTPEYLAENFDLVHHAPPCQRWSKMSQCRPGLAETYPDLITPMRPVLQASGLPYVIENVENAPLIDPVWLCAWSFGKQLYRHRGFETGNGLVVPPMRHPEHTVPASRAGHWVEGTVMSLAGHYSPTDKALELMGMSRFVPRKYVKEAAPAYFTNYIAVHALSLLSRMAA
jgi:DNA (cytosine-5)-methyltransferase 1